jgi:SSS family solute:Na+ symporter
MGIHWTGIVFGVGGALALGYWTTDFLVVQRAMAAKTLRAAKMAPILASYFKMAVPLIVVLPGLLGLALLPYKLVPATVTGPGLHSYNEVLPIMLARYCGPGLLGLGITALIAGFMSGMAGNVSAFSTVWTYDIYRPYLRKNATDAHYVKMGRWCTILGVLVSIGAAYFVTQFKSIMDYMQALVGFFISPLFGTVFIGMMWKRATHKGGFWGLLAGSGSSVAMFVLVKIDPSKIAWIALSRDAKDMAENLYRAIWALLICVIVTVVVSLLTKPVPEAELEGLVYSQTKQPSERDLRFYQRPIFWAVGSGVMFAILQWIFW